MDVYFLVVAFPSSQNLYILLVVDLVNLNNLYDFYINRSMVVFNLLLMKRKIEIRVADLSVFQFVCRLDVIWSTITAYAHSFIY